MFVAFAKTKNCLPEILQKLLPRLCKLCLLAVSTKLPPQSFSSAYVSAYTGGEGVLQAYLAQQKIITLKSKRPNVLVK